MRWAQVLRSALPAGVQAHSTEWALWLSWSSGRRGGYLHRTKHCRVGSCTERKPRRSVEGAWSLSSDPHMHVRELLKVGKSPHFQDCVLTLLLFSKPLNSALKLLSPIRWLLYSCALPLSLPTGLESALKEKDLWNVGFTPGLSLPSMFVTPLASAFTWTLCSTFKDCFWYFCPKFIPFAKGGVSLTAVPVL